MLAMAEEIRINVRTTKEIKRNLEIVARRRGMTVSSLVNSQAVKVIREEMEFDPAAFKGERQEHPKIMDLDNEIMFSLISEKDLKDELVDVPAQTRHLRPDSERDETRQPTKARKAR